MSINPRHFGLKHAQNDTFFYTRDKVFNILIVLNNSDIANFINNFTENFQKKARRKEKCCTFALLN